MGTVIDRRTGGTGKKFTTSRDRFMKRNKKQIRDAIDRSINDSDIKDIGKGGTDVTVPKDGVHEPGINHGKGGIYDKVLPGNDQYNVGDKAPRPEGGGGGGTGPGEPGDGDDGEDDFTFALTEEEFLNILFEDLELPLIGDFQANNAALAVAATLLQAGLRELQEETGFTAGTLRLLSSFWVAPGWSTEYMHAYLATDLSAASLAPDEDENISLVRVPLEEVSGLIERGEIRDAKSIASLLLAQNVLGGG